MNRVLQFPVLTRTFAAPVCATEEDAVQINGQARGVHVEDSENPGYVVVTAVDSKGCVLYRAEMLQQWYDDFTKQALYRRLERIDPDFYPVAHSIRLRLTPDVYAEEPLPLLVLMEDQTPRSGRDHGAA